MKNISDRLGMVLQGIVVVTSLMAGAVVLIIATILGKMQDFEI